MIGLCKTCQHWTMPVEADAGYSLCEPLDPDTYEPMERTFKTRVCMHPKQTMFEAPVEINGFGLTDGSKYYAALCTAEEFGCVRHEPVAQSS